jgi:hypothetical protein
MSTTHDPDLAILELRDSVAWAAGVGYERRRIAEHLRQRATLLQQMPGPTPRAVVHELRRLADELDATPS